MRREKIEALLENEPEDVFLNFALAMELTKENRFEDAIQRFDRVLELDGDYLAAYHQKAVALVSLDRPAEARDVLALGMEAATRIGNRHARSEMQDLLDTLPAPT